MISRSVWILQHIPSGQHMPARMHSGRGGWSYWNPAIFKDYSKDPRIFWTLRSAQNALTAWLQGEHKRDCGTNWDFDGPDSWDEHVINEPAFPRVRSEMLIIPLQLVPVITVA